MISVRLTNLVEFMRDTARAIGDVPKGTGGGLEKANRVILPAAIARAPRKSGRLASSGSARVTGTTGELIFTAEHAPIIEWYQQGRFSGLSSRYGSPPRFAARTLLEKEDQVVSVVEEELEPAVTAAGWFS